MTEQNENQQNSEDNSCQENILQTIHSIDRNVEDILDILNDHLDHSSYDPAWDHDYFSKH